jgi:hypothetical protein
MTPSANRGAASVLEKREQDEALAARAPCLGDEIGSTGGT